MSLDEKEEVKTTIKKPHMVTSLKVQVGVVGKTFDVRDLKKLSYFETRLSERWTKAHSQNGDEPIIVCNKDDNLGFEMKHLSTLLFIKDIKEIPLTNNLSFKDIESLLWCDDFFAEKIINEKMLITYFDKCTHPRFNVFSFSNLQSKSQRMHPSLVSVIKIMTQTLHKKENELRNMIANGSGSIHTIVSFDCNTACLSFQPKIKTQTHYDDTYSRYNYSYNRTVKKVTRTLVGFNANLWGDIEKNKWYHVYPKCVDYIAMICNDINTNASAKMPYIFENASDVNGIRTMLLDVGNGFNFENNKIVALTNKFTLTRKAIVIAVCIHLTMTQKEKKLYWSDKVKSLLGKLSNQEILSFATTLCKTMVDYPTLCQKSNQEYFKLFENTFGSTFTVSLRK